MCALLLTTLARPASADVISSTLDATVPPQGTFYFSQTTGHMSARFARDGLIGRCGEARDFPGTEWPGTYVLDVSGSFTGSLATGGRGFIPPVPSEPWAGAAAASAHRRGRWSCPEPARASAAAGRRP